MHSNVLLSHVAHVNESRCTCVEVMSNRTNFFLESSRCRTRALETSAVHIDADTLIVVQIYNDI